VRSLGVAEGDTRQFNRVAHPRGNPLNPLTLTDIGNEFMIRHTETSTVPISQSHHVDYLFHRMFSMIRLLLRASGRDN